MPLMMHYIQVTLALAKHLLEIPMVEAYYIGEVPDMDGS